MSYYQPPQRVIVQGPPPRKGSLIGGCLTFVFMSIGIIFIAVLVIGALVDSKILNPGPQHSYSLDVKGQTDNTGSTAVGSNVTVALTITNTGYAMKDCVIAVRPSDKWVVTAVVAKQNDPLDPMTNFAGYDLGPLAHGKKLTALMTVTPSVAGNYRLEVHGYTDVSGGAPQTTLSTYSYWDFAVVP